MSNPVVLPHGNPLTTILDAAGIARFAWCFGLIYLAGAWIWSQRQLPPCARALWIYVLARALLITEFPIPWFGIYNTAFEANAGRTLAEVLIVPGYALTVRPERAMRILRGLAWFLIPLIWLEPYLPGWIHAAALHAGPLEGAVEYYAAPGAILSSSFDCAFLALFLPFSCLPLALASLITILFHHGSTALLVLLAEGAAFTLVYGRSAPFRQKLGLLVVSGLALVAFLALARFHANGEMLDGGDRLAHYRRLMAFWAGSWKLVLQGAGPGAFTWVSYILDKFEGELWQTLHSDVLQIAWELGLIGAGLALAAFVCAVRRARENVPVFCALFGALAFMIPYHPLRYIHGALLIAVIFRLAYTQKEPRDFSQGL